MHGSQQVSPWRFVSALAIALAGCNYNEAKVGAGLGEAGQSAPGQVVCQTSGPASSVSLAQVLDFAAVNQAVFIPHCTRCHSTAGRDRGGVNLETYANVISWRREIESAVGTDFMPPRVPLSPDLKSMLSQWFASGAPESLSNPQQPGQPACLAREGGV
jgi:uncharacterized membrane protein